MIEFKLMELFLILPLFLWVTRFVERKWTADAQTRVGPSLVGAKGFFQPIADAIKMISKKDYILPSKSSVVLLILISACSAAMLFLSPLTAQAVEGEGAYSLFVLLVLISIQLILQVLLGWNTEQEQTYYKITKSQTIFLAALFPFFLVLITQSLRTGSFGWADIVRAQSGSLLNWGVFSFFPFGFIEMVVFCVTGTLLFRIAPFFDYPIMDVRGGVDTVIAGIVQNIGFYLFSIILVTLFFGGWNLPFGIVGEGLQILWVLFKAIFLAVSIKVMLEPIARMDADQTLSLLWKYIAPAATIGLLGSGVYQWIAL